MRMHRNVAEAIIEGLKAIHYDEHLAPYIVPQIVKKNKKWGSRDRNQIAQSIYDITRYWRKYQCLSGFENQDEQSLWKIVAAYLTEKGVELPPWEEFAEFTLHTADSCQDFVVQESIPDWLHQQGVKELGEEVWKKEIFSLNQPAEVVLRVNPLALPKQAKENPVLFVQEALLQQEIRTELVASRPFALQLAKRRSIQHTKAFQKGWIEIQDANSQYIAPFCQPQQEELIIDACAGAGGKSLHLAALVQNEADIFSLDVVPHKIKELEKRATRARVNCIEAGLVVEFPFEDFEQQADLVLVDAPCSGLGTLKRDPDKKWKLTPEFMQEIIVVQQQILQKNAALVKSGSRLIYATCSILPSENQQQVQTFLDSEIGSDFHLVEEKTMFAHQTGFDGFYMAKLVRSE